VILKPFQRDALGALRSRNIDLACVAPTGAGKGVILEEIARDPRERVLLVSPLIALGRQQAERFRAKGISAECFMGAVSSAPCARSRVWILSPEALRHPRWTAKLRAWRPTLVAVDECHCVYEWGAAFRPDYGRLPEWVRDLDVNRTLWMSATLPRPALSAIERGLGRKLAVQGRFSLPERLDLKIERVPLPSRVDRLLGFLDAHDDAGILFAGTRSGTERLDRLIAASRRESWVYHAGLSSEERRIVEARVAGLDRGVVIATSAFGMGMDYASLGWVLLWQPPGTLLSLAQALGRVGRGGRPGHARLFWEEEDFRILGFLASRSPNAEERLRELREYLELPTGEHRAALARYFV